MDFPGKLESVQENESDEDDIERDSRQCDDMFGQDDEKKDYPQMTSPARVLNISEKSPLLDLAKGESVEGSDLSGSNPFGGAVQSGTQSLNTSPVKSQKKDSNSGNSKPP